MDKRIEKFANDPSLIFDDLEKWFKIARGALCEFIIALAIYNSASAGAYVTAVCFAVGFVVILLYILISLTDE